MTDTRTPDADLADNLPGAAAQAKAEELKTRKFAFTRFTVSTAGTVEVNNQPLSALQVLLEGRPEWQSWDEGAEGERLVARELGRLGPDWRMLHAVPVGVNGSDIDHVIIGPGGVFTVNAKHHWDSRVWIRDRGFFVNGHKQLYVRNSVHEAARASKLLTAACGFPVPVTGLISVVCQLDKLTIQEQPTVGVRVEHYRMAPEWIESLDVRLTPGQAASIYASARLPGTWQG